MKQKNMQKQLLIRKGTCLQKKGNKLLMNDGLMLALKDLHLPMKGNKLSIKLVQ